MVLIVASRMCTKELFSEELCMTLVRSKILWMMVVASFNACRIRKRRKKTDVTPVSLRFVEYSVNAEEKLSLTLIKNASSGNRTQDICLEGRYFTTKLMMRVASDNNGDCKIYKSIF